IENELRKLKGKNVVDTAVSKPIATIALGMFKLDIEPISYRLKNNKDAHEVYLEKTIENTNTLRGLVEYARKQNPSEPLLESPCMFTKHVQELLVYVSKRCPSLTKPYEKLVAVTPTNKDKKFRQEGNGLFGSQDLCLRQELLEYMCVHNNDASESSQPSRGKISDWSNGYVRKADLNCAGGDGFVKQRGVKVPDTQKTWFNVSMNLEECEKVCLRNCNCTAYANSDVRSGGSGCLIWLDALVDIRMYGEDGQDIYVRMAASELHRKLKQETSDNFRHSEDMELESTNSGPTAKLPILKLGEYEMWVIRIKQYFQIQDYALWEVIENEEKTNKKNDVKARGLLLMALPNEHQLTFSHLPPEWNTHVVVWMNKPKVETMSIDDLYNNFKIIEQKVKKTVGTSSGGQNLAFMTAPSSSSTNDANTACPQVNADNPSDLKQIHEDDLEAMDLKWWSVTTVISWDTLPESAEHQEARTVSSEIKTTQDSQGNLKTLFFKGIVVYTDKTCSKTCLKNYETLKKQCDDLLVKLNESDFKAATYKRGLATIEAQLITYKKNEVLFSEEVVALKREVGQVNAVRVTWVNAVKSSAYWFENLTNFFFLMVHHLLLKDITTLMHEAGSKGKPQHDDKGFVDSGCSRHMTADSSQNGVAERRNRTLIEAARTMLADSKLPTTFWAEAVSTACYVHTGLGKFDGKSDEGFFVGYSFNSKAFRVYNTRTGRVEENLHIRFLDKKPMIEGNGTSEENSQDCIVMPIWKDTSSFDSPTKDVDNGEPKTADDAQKQVEDGQNNENAKQESLKLNVVGPSVNTASPNEQDSTEEEPEVDLGNITNSYIVPTTPNTRIHKDHQLTM
ncbi:putative ribonuclease H-like domain-containing protein, partial [Tanacetum coccineum]